MILPSVLVLVVGVVTVAWSGAFTTVYTELLHTVSYKICWISFLFFFYLSHFARYVLSVYIVFVEGWNRVCVVDSFQGFSRLGEKALFLSKPLSANLLAAFLFGAD